MALEGSSFEGDDQWRVERLLDVGSARASDLFPEVEIPENYRHGTEQTFDAVLAAAESGYPRDKKPMRDIMTKEGPVSMEEIRNRMQEDSKPVDYESVAEKLGIGVKGKGIQAMKLGNDKRINRWN